MPKKTIQRQASQTKKQLSEKRIGTARTLRIPVTDPLRDLRRAKCRATLQEAAALAIEAGYTRDRLLNALDDLLVATVVENFPGNTRLAASVLEVPDRFVASRWEGLKPQVVRERA